MLRYLWDAVRVGLLVAFSTLAEKNPLRQSETPGRVVLSASRVVIVAMVYVWIAVGLVSPTLFLAWPYVTLGALLSIALPINSALQRSSPAEVLEYGKMILARLGVGESIGPRITGAATAVGIPGAGLLGGIFSEPVPAAPEIIPPPPEIPTPELPGMPVEPLAEPATLRDARSPLVAPPAPAASDLASLDRLLQVNGITRFTAAELAKPGRRHPSGAVNGMPPRALWDNMIPTAKVLQWLRDRVGRPVNVISGYRSLAYNRGLGKKPDGSYLSPDGSLHVAFCAADIQVPGLTPARVAALLETHPDAARFGLGTYSSFVHLDTRGVIGRPAPARWKG